MNISNNHDANTDISISSEVPGLVKLRGCNSCLLRACESKSWQGSRLQLAERGGGLGAVLTAFGSLCNHEDDDEKNVTNLHI